MAYEKLLYVLGLLTIGYVGLNLCSFSWLYIRPSSIARYLRDSKDARNKNWALVTGATDGIGRAFAAELCRRGFHVVLHGRNPSKLERVQEELSKGYPNSQTRIVISDADRSPTSSLENDILAKVGDIELSVLINNVGGTVGVQSHDETFNTLDKYSVAAVDGLININARFSTHITRILLPLLYKRPRSLIMNISSMSQFGFPYISVYCGTKAYITTWSKALAAEMQAEEQNVEVLAISVGTVRTTNFDVVENLFQPTAETFARATMERVGCGKASVEGYLPHALQQIFLSHLPASIARRMVIGSMKGLKDRAVKKK